MIKEQINEEFLSPYLQPVLAADEGEAVAKLKEKTSDVFHECILQFTFRVSFM